MERGRHPGVRQGGQNPRHVRRHTQELCPALSGWITARTCGQHRLKKIRCPSDCKYLDQHERFRHAKAAEGFHLAWARTVTPIYQRQDRDALDWLLACEFALYRQLRENPSTPDEAVAAIYAE